MHSANSSVRGNVLRCEPVACGLAERFRLRSAEHVVCHSVLWECVGVRSVLKLYLLCAEQNRSEKHWTGRL